MVQEVKKVVPEPIKPNEKPPPPPPPPMPELSAISRDGLADVKFSEPMKVPNFRYPNFRREL